MASASTDFRHDMPPELGAILDQDEAFQARWNGLTELGRNEWICWMTSARKQQTRGQRLARLREEVAAGKRRPCCWPGCPHRRESAGKWFND